MARLAIQAEPTKFHHLLAILDNCGILQRIYSQNIDGLEAKVGFEIFSKEKNRRCILLHGNVATVQCKKCATPYMLENFLPLLQVGKPIDCPACVDRKSNAKALAKRAKAPGLLRPNILLFNEPCPMAYEIADISSSDANLVHNNHVLLISGTSLKIPGIKSILNCFTKAMSKRINCTTIYVDNAPQKPPILPPNTLHLQMDCQLFAELTTPRIKSHFSAKEARYILERRDFRPLWDWS